jgi:hypothetical protein
MRSSRWTRLGLGLRAGLAALLAGGAAWLLVDLADWRYLRVDLTRTAQNTLDPALLDLVDRLPESVVIDAFLRPFPPKTPYEPLSRAAEGRLLEFLAVLQHARRAQVEIRVHPPQDFETIKERQRELGTDGTNKLVISCGERRDELELYGELCSIDWGNPSREGVKLLVEEMGIPGVIDPRRWQPDRGFRPATLLEFRGEELLAQALLKVASGEAPKVYFARGHGEPSLEGSEPTDLARLRAALEGDGFRVGEWDPLKEPSLPADCAVLALIGPAQPYQSATRAALQAYMAAGGRLVAAPDLAELDEERAGGVVELLRGFGIDTRPGIVCLPLVAPTGEPVEGTEQCAWLVIDEKGLQAGHQLTEPLRMRGRRVQFTFTPSFEGLTGEWGPILPIVSAGIDSWRDLPPRNDWSCNLARGEERKRHTLVTERKLKSVKESDGSLKQGHVLAVASAYFFSNQLIDVNRDFALNAFNLLASREYRLAVKPLARSESFLDFERSSARPILTYLLWLVLPGLCAGVGLVVFLRRRS